MQVFFCKYNDPVYVKMEKVNIMTRLATDRNIDQVGRGGGRERARALPGRARRRTHSPSTLALQILLEFKEYATEVDVEFVRKAVRAIGRCAVSIEAAAERCAAARVRACPQPSAQTITLSAHLVERANSHTERPPCPPPSRPRRCINVLLELISTRVNYVVQEAMVVIKDIFRCAGAFHVARRAGPPNRAHTSLPRRPAGATPTATRACWACCVKTWRR